MKISHTFDSLADWALPRLASPPDLAARLRIRVDDGRVSWSADADDVATEAGGLVAVDWIRDNAAPPCLVRMDWVDGSGAFVKTAGQRTFSLPAEERAEEPDGSPAPRPTVTAPRLGTIIDVDGVRLPLTRTDGPDPDRLLQAAAAAPGLPPEATAYLTVALAARAEAAAAREESRVLLAGVLQMCQVQRETTAAALHLAAGLGNTVRQTRAATDAMLPELVAQAIAAERSAGDDRARAAVAEARAGMPAADPEEEGGATGSGEVAASLAELRGLVNDGAALVASKRLGKNGPTLAALKAAADGKPAEMAAWAASLSPADRLEWVGKLGPVVAALAS